MQRRRRCDRRAGADSVRHSGGVSLGSSERLAEKKKKKKKKKKKLTLPVAPQQASLASSNTTVLPSALGSSERNLAAEVPVMPLPTMTMSASLGRSSVVRWPSRNWLGSLCQKELDDVGVGSVARGCFMVGMVAGGGRGWRGSSEREGDKRWG